MKVSVHQRGGFLGLDREVRVDGNRVEITDKGATPRVHSLAAADVARVRELATRVARVGKHAVQHRSELPSDVLATKIAIQDGSRRRSLTVRTGDTAPDEVWDLIGELDRFSVPD